MEPYQVTEPVIKSTKCCINNWLSGYAYFTVWMAEIPLEISVPDTRLSMINNWKIPDSIEK